MCNDTNKNIFESKPDVYLDGGPRRIGSAGLPDGNYYVKVTDPSGAVLLGSMTAAQFLAAPVVVEAGSFKVCYQLLAIVTQPDGTTVGYLDTPNNGLEYKVWVSQDPTFPEYKSKTDNFKVKNLIDPPPPPVGKLTVVKFYDANANGVLDLGESEIVGWKVNITPLLPNTGDQFTPYTALLPVPGSYTAFEYMPLETNWYQTKPQLPTTTLTANFPSSTVNDPVTLYFGNVCTGPGGGKTLGFWSNKNGQALFGADDLAAMVALNLRNADGSNFNPASYAEFRSWILSATATNMSYMLSAQLAAMKLNVFNGLVNGASLLYSPGATSANSFGFASVNALIAEANATLATDGLVTSGNALRSYQEALKNALDNGNNNRNFVQATACVFTF